MERYSQSRKIANTLLNRLFAPDLLTVRRFTPRTGEADLSRGITLALPPELATAALPLPAGPYPITIQYIRSRRFEYNRIQIEPDHCLITAGSLAGARYGLYRLAELLRAAGGPFLPLGTTTRHTVVKERIGRCFAGPINRPPLYHDELTDDFNFYPDSYLDALARSGVTGVWISSDFRKLGRSFLYPTDPNRPRRLAKLRTIVEKCARYGLKVYIFCIEPIAFAPDDPVISRFPELGGTPGWGKITFCPNSETAQKYLYEVTFHLFSEVPGLGGIINLSVGEWATLCCNIRDAKCPRCGNVPPWQTLNQSLSAMNAGMKAATPDAHLISWPYTQVSYWNYRAAVEAASHVPPQIALMHNFESYGGEVQQEKMRRVTDYWLSWVGPSKFFRTCAERCREHDSELFAKLQVGCSTEIATTGYLPVPALIYRKFRTLRQLGVTGISLGWYFGSFPSLMNEAALRLSQNPFPRSEKAFLLELARIHWQDHAPVAAKAWRLFSDAFSNYPLLNVLAYIGPMHDSIAWKLHLKPVNRRLAPSWNNRVDAPGDRIYEALVPSEKHHQGFTLTEMISQLRTMTRHWRRGVKLMESLCSPKCSESQLREIELARAIGIIFEDATEIFQFYLERERLLDGTSKSLAAIRQIAHRAIERSRQMLPLIKNNPSLGYHSEATDYKFSPALIRSRIRHLEKLLEHDLPAAARTLAAELPLYPEATGLRPHGPVAVLNGPAIPLTAFGHREITWDGAYQKEHFVREPDTPPHTAFRVEADAENLYLTLYFDEQYPNDRFRILWEPRPFHWPERIDLYPNGAVTYTQRPVRLTASPVPGGVRLTLPLAVFGLTEPGRSRLNIERIFTGNGREKSLFWLAPHFLQTIFVLGNFNPKDFGWLVPSTASTRRTAK